MELDNRAWTKIAMILIAIALLMPLAGSFSGTSTIYSVNKTTMGIQGDTGTGYYDARFTTTPYQPGDYPAKNDQYTANIGWFETTRGNIEPNITQIYILSSSGRNYSEDRITCYVNATDPDNTTLTVYYRWYNSTIQIPSLSGQATVQSDIVTNISTLSSSNTSAGENWTCEAKSWDGYYNETDWNNASIIIIAKQVPGGAAGGAGPGGVIPKEVPQPCIEAWICSPWSPCINKLKTRECTDLNSCGTENFKPTEEKACEPPIEKPEERITEEAQIEKPQPIKKTLEIISNTIKRAINAITDILNKTIDTIKQIINTTAHIAKKIITAIEQAVHGIFSAITFIIKTIIDLLTSAAKALITWMTYDNVSYALLVLIYILLILTAITALRYFIKQYYTEHRGRKLIKKTYTLLKISIIALAAHFILFQQEAYPAYIATITMIILLALDWHFKREPIRIRRKIRTIEKIRSYKDYLKETSKLIKSVDRYLIKAPAKPEEKETLSREDKYRFTRMKNIIKGLAHKTSKPIETIRKPIKDISRIRPIKVEQFLGKSAQFNEKIREYLEQRKAKQIHRKTELELAKEQRKLEREQKRRAKEFRKQLKQAERITKKTLKVWPAKPEITIKHILSRKEEDKYTKTKEAIQQILRKTKKATLSELDRKIQQIKEEQEKKKKEKEKIKQEKARQKAQRKQEKQRKTEQKRTEKAKKALEKQSAQKHKKLLERRKAKLFLRRKELHKKLEQAKKITKEAEQALQKTKTPVKIRHILSRKEEDKYTKTKEFVQQIIRKTKEKQGLFRETIASELDRKIQQIKEEQEKKRKQREKIKQEKARQRAKRRKERERKKELKKEKRRQEREREKAKRKLEKERKAKENTQERKELLERKKAKLLLRKKEKEKRQRVKEEKRIEKELKKEAKEREENKIKEQKQKEKAKRKAQKHKELLARREEKRYLQRLKEEIRIERELKAEAKEREENKLKEQRKTEKAKRRTERAKRLEAKERKEQRKDLEQKRLQTQRKIERETKRKEKQRKAEAKEREKEIRLLERKERKEKRKTEREEINQEMQTEEAKRKLEKQNEKEINKISQLNRELNDYLKSKKKRKKKHKTEFEILAEKVRAVEKD